jgi:plastocyanin
LFMSGGTYSVTLDTAGEYPYFCMVHPWMIGNISVN